MKLHILITALIAWLAPLAAMAQSPATIPVQGRLMDATGAPVAESLPVTFTMYSDAAGNAVLWSDTVLVAFDDGNFTVYLGKTNGNAIDLAVFRDYPAVYLGVKIDTSEEMSLFEIATAPYAGYAVYSGDAATVAGQNPTALAATVRTELQSTGSIHNRYTDAEAVAAVGSHYTDAQAVAAVAGLHYTDAQAIAAVGPHYTDAQAITAVGPHYTDAQAIAAVGPHYTDAEAIAAVNLAGISESALPSNGIDEITNGVIRNEFSNSYSSSSIAILDQYPPGVSDTITVPDLGVAVALKVHVRIDSHLGDLATSAGIADLKITLSDPDGTPYTLYDRSLTGPTLDTSWPDLTPLVLGDLATWTGRNAMGSWTLTVVDSAFLNNTNDGEIVTWDITVDTVSSARIDVDGDMTVTGTLSVQGNVEATSLRGDFSLMTAARSICYGGMATAYSGPTNMSVIMRKVQPGVAVNTTCQGINSGWFACGVAKSNYIGQNCSDINNMWYDYGYTSFVRGSTFEASRTTNYSACDDTNAVVCCSPACNGW